MPKRFAITTGNWSDTSTWDSGDVLGIPTSSDDVWTNGSTVNINQSFIVNSLNNSGTTTNTSGMSAPMVTQDAIPMMTSFTTPEGLAFASNYAVDREPWKAFDGTSIGWVSTTTNTGFLGYQFTSPKNIKRYAWRAASLAAQAPSRWTFEGSNDNTTYTVLDTVTASLAAEAVYTSTLLANTASFSFYRMNISAVNTLNNTPVTRELEMTESTSSATGGASGGAYNFNTADVSASITSTITPISLVANNSITVTATTGTINISAPFAAFAGGAFTQLISHSGNCNLIITGSSFIGGSTGTTNTINKSSTGLITLVGNLFGNIAGSVTTNYCLNSTNGNTLIVGNVIGSTNTLGNSNQVVNQIAGSLTIVGNITGGVANTSAGNNGINFSGTSLTVTGSITGGSGANPGVGINITGTPTINISGSVFAASANGLLSTTANTTNIVGNIVGSSAATSIAYSGAATIVVTGSLIAGTLGGSITSTSTSATTIVRGNLINTNGRMAFYGPNLRLASGSLTTWQFTSSTGTDRTLYTLDQIGDQPLPSNVRTGISYASGSLTGTMAVPPLDSVALGVPVDNTTGSAVLNPTYVADEIWNQPTSTLTVSGSIGERIKNAATVQSTGAQIAALAGGN